MRADTRRELVEECGLPEGKELILQICGFGRYLYRAGKPEFFCVATTELDYHDINVPIKEWDWQHKDKKGMKLPQLSRGGTFEEFRNSVAGGLDAHAASLEADHASEPVSGPLLWNLKLASDYLKGAKEAKLKTLLAPLFPPS